MDAPGKWLGEDPATGFHLVERPDGRVLRIADLVEDNSAKREKVVGALKDPRRSVKSRPRRYHPRARHGEGGVRLDMVRTRAHRRLWFEPDRDHSNHRTCDARRAWKGERTIRRSDRRADAGEEAVRTP